ncbi:DUF881 domain-containing protein [Bifidobacterium pullorum]
MMPIDDAPRSFPVEQENTPLRRRAVFSASVAAVDSHHVRPAGGAGAVRGHRRKLDDDSLKLIDDLTNRPMDPLFMDSRLAKKPSSPAATWATRVVVFVICVAVGFAGALFVQQLHTDPRRAVRESWASELEDQTSQVEDLTGQIIDLRGQIDEITKDMADYGQNDTLIQDELSSGMLPVEGEGITLTLADPIAADGALPRESSGGQIRVVTDADLQQLVSLLWQSGAEAMAVNGYRLGVQTSIRTAGQTILIGVNSIESPYTIQAIGDKNTLAHAVSADSQPALYESYAESGIYPQVAKSDSIRLEAAVSGDVTHARRSE